MRIVSAQMQVPDAALAAFREAAGAVQAATNAEPGCVTFVLTQALDVPNRFHVFEVFEDDASIAAHRETSHYANFVEALKQLGVTGQTSHYDATARASR